ncbi:hypothetical protein GGI21_001656, partial [Coemansia aciculifera]
MSSSTTSDDVASTLQALVGDTRVLSSEDMVVALSQAILLSSGFEFIDRRAWNSPGLPQAHCAAVFTRPAKPGSITEIKWITLGANVMMLAVGLDGANNAEHAGIKTINITTRHIVKPDAEFPFSLVAGSTAADLSRVLADNAVEKLTAAVRAQLMSDNRGELAADAKRELAAATQLPHEQETASSEEGSGISMRRNPASVGHDDLNPLGYRHPFGYDGHDLSEGGGMI